MFIPEPKFYLKDRNSTDPTLIYMQAKYTADNPQRFMLSTGDKILPAEWDDNKQRAIVSKKTLLNGDLNLWLDKMANAFKTEFRGFLLKGKVPNTQELKDRIEEVLNIKVCVAAPVIKQITFCSFIRTFIDDCKGSKAFNTIKSYVSTLNRVKDMVNYVIRNFLLMTLILSGGHSLLSSCSHLEQVEIRKGNISRT